MSALVLRGGRVIDPLQGVDRAADLVIRDGRIAELIDPGQAVGNLESLDVKGLWVMPGFIDLRCVINDPADLTAALAGGYTTLVASPESEAVPSPWIRVLRAAALTKHVEGEELGEVPADAVCLSNGSRPIVRGGLMRRALQYSRPLKVPVMIHAEDPSLSGRGVLGEGFVATWLGLPSVPASAEVSVVARDLALLEEQGGRLHFSHLTCAGSLRLLKDARQRGLKVTADATPHHLTMTDDAARGYAIEARVWPPLRPAADVAALVAAVRDGTIDAIASDHHRIDPVEREHPFDQCTPGAQMLAQAFGRVATLKLEPTQLARLFSSGPAAILSLEGGSLAPRTRADLTIVDPAQHRVRYTLIGGEVRFTGAS
ncbi:MAG: dihydroorotase [Myxococcaceae bacterium]|nr:dihydroorotase [Myxococcaceae bacterium]